MQGRETPDPNSRRNRLASRTARVQLARGMKIPALCGLLAACAPILAAADESASENAGGCVFADPASGEWPPAERTPEEIEADRRARFSFFWAIAAGDIRAACSALNAGRDPDCELPEGTGKYLFPVLPDEQIRYYVTAEHGFTPLMLAAAKGDRALVEILLAAGADPNKKTRRHRTFALWLAGKRGSIDIMRMLMRIGEGDPSRGFVIRIDLSAQKLSVSQNGEFLLESPISSGRNSHPTPSGTYLVTDKYPMWKSTLYHAKMPHFLRLSCGDFGLHAGNLPGYPASHGCIRLPAQKARELYAATPIGALVEIR